MRIISPPWGEAKISPRFRRHAERTRGSARALSPVRSVDAISMNSHGRFADNEWIFAFSPVSTRRDSADLNTKFKLKRPSVASARPALRAGIAFLFYEPRDEISRRVIRELVSMLKLRHREIRLNAADYYKRHRAIFSRACLARYLFIIP